jgi:predicted dehydrogenase
MGRIFSADITVGQYLPDWRPDMDYSKVYSAIRAQGGGVCLDISHELDYFRWLFGEPAEMKCQVRKLSDLNINVEDLAEILVYTHTGVLGRIHLDYLSRAPRRQLYLVAEKGNLQYDFLTYELKIYDADTGSWQIREFKEDRNEQYIRQLRHFMHCARDGIRPLVDVDDAIKTLEFALKIREYYKE